MRISDWSSDVCSSDLAQRHVPAVVKQDPLPVRRVVGHGLVDEVLPIAQLGADVGGEEHAVPVVGRVQGPLRVRPVGIDLQRRPHPVVEQPGQPEPVPAVVVRSEEHTSEVQSLMRISYAVFCLKKKKQKTLTDYTNEQ